MYALVKTCSLKKKQCISFKCKIPMTEQHFSLKKTNKQNTAREILIIDADMKRKVENVASEHSTNTKVFVVQVMYIF